MGHNFGTLNHQGIANTIVVDPWTGGSTALPTFVAARLRKQRATDGLRPLPNSDRLPSHPLFRRVDFLQRAPSCLAQTADCLRMGWEIEARAVKERHNHLLLRAHINYSDSGCGLGLNEAYGRKKEFCRSGG